MICLHIKVLHAVIFNGEGSEVKNTSRNDVTYAITRGCGEGLKNDPSPSLPREEERPTPALPERKDPPPPSLFREGGIANGHS